MSPHPIDLHVGARLRTRRRDLGLSQTQLATVAGITFQQVQKYERGANRVSASKLCEFAAALGVPPGYFFDGLAQPQADTSPELALAEQARRTVAAEHATARLLDRLADMGPATRAAALKAIGAMLDSVDELIAASRRKAA